MVNTGTGMGRLPYPAFLENTEYWLESQGLRGRCVFRRERGERSGKDYCGSVDEAVILVRGTFVGEVGGEVFVLPDRAEEAQRFLITGLRPVTNPDGSPHHCRAALISL